MARGIGAFVLGTYIVGGMGVKELHIDSWVKVVPALEAGVVGGGGSTTTQT